MDNLEILQNSIKTQQEVIDLVGESTTLGFEFFGEGIASYKTLVPISIQDRLVTFELELDVVEKNVLGICKYDSFSGLLRNSVVIRLMLVCELTGEEVTLYNK